MKKVFSLVLAFSLAVSPMVITSNVYADKTEATKHMEHELVNINTASVKQFLKLPGIGKKKAQAIVDYREEHGDFSSVEEIVKVSGIGKKVSEKLADKISVE